MSTDLFDGINWNCKRCGTSFDLRLAGMAGIKRDCRCPKCKKKVTLREIQKRSWNRICEFQKLYVDPHYGGVGCALGFTCTLSNCPIPKRVDHGKCPSCKEPISKNDLAPLLTPLGGIAWVCKKCKTIIGFESARASAALDFDPLNEGDEEERRRMDDDMIMWDETFRRGK